ncbi:MAG: hypothetical protein M3O36_08790 [Myxococcota bacterium]|nr:hypothetical protein [Myxococcota bacterium]
MKKVALSLLAAAATSVSAAVVFACPYASSAGARVDDCGACSAGLFGYGSWLVLGVGAGIASVAFERRRR